VKRVIYLIPIVLFILIVPGSIPAEDAGNKTSSPAAATTGVPTDKLSQADVLLEDEGLENCKKALDICLLEVENNPDDYQANWMAAKACRKYSNEVKKSEASDWKESCKQYGKKGMGYAEKAIELDPGKPDGHYWYAVNVGIYMDGVSILTALKEGLKEKTRTSLESAYKMNRNYDKAGVIAALGRFWQVLPWIAGQNKEKSKRYYREFQKSKYARIPGAAELNVYFAELLMEKKETMEEARTLLLDVPKLTKDNYWNRRATALLSE
jgi:hypothetical protein